MIHHRICAFAAACAASAAVGCSGTAGEVTATARETTTMAALADGAVTTRAYVGSDDVVTVGARPATATMGLLGGSQLELEVVTPDGSPVRFEVWQGHVDGTATLRIPVDASSGFALEQIAPDEDGTWAVVFPAGTPGQVIVHADCIGGLRGCTALRQPGESCPAGWACDEGLACRPPGAVCVRPDGAQQEDGR
jgi:hypothetical protein